MKQTMRQLVIEFIGTHNGVTTTDVQKFIVTQLQGRQWYPQRRCGLWNVSLYGHGRTEGIFPTKCVKVGKHWYLNKQTHDWLVFHNPNSGKTFYSAPQVTDRASIKPTDKLSTGQEIQVQVPQRPMYVGLQGRTQPEPFDVAVAVLPTGKPSVVDGPKVIGDVKCAERLPITVEKLYADLRAADQKIVDLVAEAAGLERKLQAVRALREQTAAGLRKLLGI